MTCEKAHELIWTINGLYKINWEKHITKLIFPWIRCNNGDSYLPLSITNPLFRYLELVHILEFLVFLRN
jgi:hypothetical protein